MKTAIRYIWWILISVIVIIQFIPVEFPVSNSDNPNDLFVAETIPENVANIIKPACYDCHSNETIYPWYSHVAPFKFLIIHDIEEGRADLNLSEWSTFKKRDKIKVLSEIADEIEAGNMPFPAYKITHREARLSDEQKQLIVTWTAELSEKIMGE